MYCIAAGFDDASWLAYTRNKLDDSCFHDPHMRKLWNQLLQCLDAGNPLDPRTIPMCAENPAFVMECYTCVTIAAHRDWHVAILRNASLIRRKKEALAKGIEILDTFHPSADVSAAELNAQVTELLDNAEKIPGKPLNSRTLDEVCIQVVDEIEERRLHPGRLIGTSTGFSTIDRKTGGLQPGKVWVFAGQPGDGKSVALQNVAEAALEAGKRVRWYPLEMADTEQVARMICSQSLVPNQRLFGGLETRAEQEAVHLALARMKRMKLELVDTDNATATDIFADIEETRPDVAIIDYLQLMNEETRRGENREQTIARISRMQKSVAKRTKCCILNASQLNDAGKLRESRAIGQDADVIFHISKPDTDDDNDNQREWFCTKNRGGPRHWTQKMRFLGGNFQFREEQ